MNKCWVLSPPAADARSGGVLTVVYEEAPIFCHPFRSGESCTIIH